MIFDYSFVEGKNGAEIKIFEGGSALQSERYMVIDLFGIPQDKKVIEAGRNHFELQHFSELHAPYVESSYDFAKPTLVIDEGLSAIRLCRLANFAKDKSNTVFCNAYIQAQLSIKMLFYLHCKNNKKLAGCIPETYFATPQTLEDVKKQLKDNQIYVIKPSDGTRGEGIQKLYKHEINLKTILADPDFQNRHYLFNPNHYVFIIQEEVNDKQFSSKTTMFGSRRVFINVYGDIATGELTFYFPLAYSKQQSFGKDKKFQKLTLQSEEQNQLQNFCHEFILSQHDKENKKFKILAIELINNFLTQSAFSNKPYRMLQISLIGQTLVNESYSTILMFSDLDIAKLKNFFKSLTHNEKKQIAPDLKLFFEYSLIGEAENPILSGLCNKKMESFFYDYLEFLSIDLENGFDSIIKIYLIANKIDQTVAASERGFPGHNLELLKSLTEIKYIKEVNENKDAVLHIYLKKMLENILKKESLKFQLFFNSLHDKNYNQALRRLCTFKHSKIIEVVDCLFLYAWQKINVLEPNNNGHNALYLAEKNDNEELYKFMVAHCLPPQEQDKYLFNKVEAKYKQNRN